MNYALGTRNFCTILMSSKKKNSSALDFFLASKNMHWIPVGASVFATNIGSGNFVGLAGSGAASGIGVASFELNAIFVLILLAWVFIPVYMAAEVNTMPEYLTKRFGGDRIRICIAVLSLLLYIFTKIAADLYAGALFIQLALGYDGDQGEFVSIFILLLVAAGFTIAGGLSALMWADLVQTVLMVIGAVGLMILSFRAVGGYNELVRKYVADEASGNASTCGVLPGYSMHLFRPILPGESDLPWTGMLTGMTISSIWFWCADQVTVQRVLAAKSLTHAKAGCLFAAVLKFLPMYLVVFPGMAARILYKNTVACSTPEVCSKVCGSKSGCTNIAYPELVLNLLPVGLTGTMVAVMLAAILCSLTSIFNSASTIFTMDIWSKIRKQASDVELLVVGRVSIVVLLAISVAWVPILRELRSAELFVYVNQVANFLAPPITAIFMMAILIPRTTEEGAFWGLMIGLFLGVARFVLEYCFPAPLCSLGLIDTRARWIKWFVDDIHYLHYGLLLFLVTFAITLTISLISQPTPATELIKLTFWTRHNVNTSEQPEVQEDKDAIIETELEKRLTNSCAIVLLVATVSIFVYYA
ncbi:sodium/glucose cotransporter 4 [Folsomia candida]|uniref:sodium/glucose cotransporter 4 n=1 Tax=Folsomia candida TaxID=158441 RepID=UPI000B8FDC5F|nr:sodium/glucose cotransporter 4 [Folsomia candida]